MKRISAMSEQSSPLPTDRCKKCKKTYAEHSRMRRYCPEGSAEQKAIGWSFSYNHERVFTPAEPVAPAPPPASQPLWNHDYTKPLTLRGEPVASDEERGMTSLKYG